MNISVGTHGADISLPLSGTQLREEIPHVNQVIVEDLLRFVQELENGAITHRIEDALSFFPAFDDVALSQDGQLLGKRALLNSQSRAQLIDAYLTISQSIKDLDPQGVGKSFEELGSE
jgi:hypothetical protein